MNCNEEFLKKGPYCVSYKGEYIGVTLDSPIMNFEPDFYEALCNQTGCETVCKIITNIKIKISISLKEPDRNFASFYDAQGKKINIIFDENVLITGGSLCLSPVAGNENITYCFPRTVLIPESAFAYKNTEGCCLKINFEVYEDSEGVLIKKYSR